MASSTGPVPVDGKASLGTAKVGVSLSAVVGLGENGVAVPVGVWQATSSVRSESSGMWLCRHSQPSARVMLGAYPSDAGSPAWTEARSFIVVL